MVRLTSEKIEVQRGEASPTPISFEWRGEVHDVVEVVREWVDTGFGTAPERSRKWFNRRHRRYYVVKDSAGDTFEIYFDYADRRKPTWWLTKKLDKA